MHQTLCNISIFTYSLRIWCAKLLLFVTLIKELVVLEAVKQKEILNQIFKDSAVQVKTLDELEEYVTRKFCWYRLFIFKMTSELQKKKWKQSWKNLEFLTFFWSKYFKRRMEYRLTSDLIGFHYSYYNQNNKYLHLYML